MKLLTGPLTQRITEVLTRHGVVSDWQQGALPGSNTGPPLFMAQQQRQLKRPNYVFSFDARKAFDTAPHGALHLILRHFCVPPKVIDLLLFLHTCRRLRIVTAHGLTQPDHMLRGVWQGNPESPLLYAPPGAPAQGAGAPPAPAGRGRARPHPGLHRRPAGSGPHAAAFHRGCGGDGRVPGDDGHGAQTPQVRHGHHGGGPGPAAALLSPPGKPMALGTSGGLRPLPGTPAAAGQGVLPAVQAPLTPGGGAPLMPQHPCATESGAGRHPGDPWGGDIVHRPFHRHLDNITVQVAKDRARYAFDASRGSLQDDRTLGLTRLPTRCQQAAVALVGTLVHNRSASVRAEVTKMFWEIASAHG